MSNYRDIWDSFNSPPAEFYDVHRHLGGSTTPRFVHSTLADLGSQMTLEDVKARMVVTERPYEFDTFLSKFTILDDIPWTYNLLRQSIVDVCAELKKERVKYCWMDFSVNKYMANMPWSKVELIEYLHSLFNEFLPGRVGLVLSLKYETLHEDYDMEYLELLTSETIDKLVGIDLVGDETKLDRELCRKVLRPWKRMGKMVRMHVAEACGVDNAEFAVREIEVTNIAHGIKILERPELVQAARKAGIVFDLALTSNYMTGVLDTAVVHPIKQMMAEGLRCTISSDDPVQLGVTVESEQQLAYAHGLTQWQIDTCHETAAKSVKHFMPKKTAWKMVRDKSKT